MEEYYAKEIQFKSTIKYKKNVSLYTRRKIHIDEFKSLHNVSPYKIERSLCGLNVPQVGSVSLTGGEQELTHTRD